MRKAWFAGLLLGGLLSAASDSRLSEAAMQGNKEMVRSLLKEHADVDGAQGDGSTALHWAAFHDDVDMVKMLLAAGANVKVATREEGITPLFMACQNGDAAIIEALLKAGADAKALNGNGTTALMTAAASGSVDAVKALVEHGADVKAKESAHSQTALMFAAALNRDGVVRYLLAHGAEPNVTTAVTKVERVRFDQDGNVVEDRPGAPGAGGRGGRGGRGAAAAPPPRTAAEQDKADEAADSAAAAEAAKKATETARAELDALAHALEFKSADFLLAKPKPRAGDVAFRAPRRVGAEFMGGNTALLYAAREGHMEAVRALVEGGADVNVVSADKVSPLVMAITNGHYDLAKYLLEHGADPNLASVAGLTALYAAIDVQWAPHAWFPQPNIEQEKTGYLDLMKELVDHKADVNAPISEKLWFRSFTNDYTWVDPAGATPFWRAAQSSDVPAMKLLVEHGANPKTATKSGDTPLMAAAGIGWAANWSVNAPIPAIEAVKYCVELGDDVNAADNRGYTALHGAAYLGNNDMVNYLMSKGANIKAKSRAGDTVADMANGPTRFGQPHLETVALLEKLGSANSHNCRSDQCVVQANATIYQRPMLPGEQAV
ncbi:MAG TPA: ankyrin repeat domain-containing protein, partial [Candidatus Sulfopaludibacter sp.]|nr:ankyrin repeat domain-containing protein [Candidatus Sulfopaludibacter sp.]